MNNDHPTLSIIVPVYNESLNIYPFYERMTPILEGTGYSYEIIFVNDGSKDDTVWRLKQLNDKDGRVKLIDFSRNFGKEIAMTAGLHLAAGEAVIPIDVDLQDPPEIIPQLIAKWNEGYDVVYATRTKREGETWMKKLTALIFYRFIKKITKINIPQNTGDFRLMSRQVVDALNELPEHHRFMKGLFSWVGFRQTSIPYLRERRHQGTSKFNYWKLWNFALEGITSFSFWPLQVASYVGITAALFAIIYAIYLIATTILIGNPVPGYPSLMVAVLFLGGVQLITLGVIGEYIGRIYNETKRRPLYIIREKLGFQQKESGLHAHTTNNYQHQQVNRHENSHQPAQAQQEHQQKLTQQQQGHQHQQAHQQEHQQTPAPSKPDKMRGRP
jgi:glycosyltransferase involved in cell wall biosynthesis